MRLSILAATLPALFSIACDGATTEQSSTAQPTPVAPALVEPPVRPAEPTEPTEQADQCEEVTSAAFDAIETARRVDNGCDSDAACTLRVGESACGGAPVHAVSFSGLAAFELAFERVDAELCSTLDPKCGIAVWDLAGQPRAMCVEGQCELGVTEPQAAEAACTETTERYETIEGCLGCGFAAEKAWNALDALVDEYNACESDSDCAQVSDDTGCASGCGNAINAAHVEAYNEARSTIGADYCTGCGCPIAMAGCLPQAAVCEAGRCALVGTF